MERLEDSWVTWKTATLQPGVENRGNSKCEKGVPSMGVQLVMEEIKMYLSGFFSMGRLGRNLRMMHKLERNV